MTQHGSASRDARPAARPSRFAYAPPVLHHGVGAVAALEGELADRGLERALVVCGRSVGANDDALGPVRDALAGRLAGVVDETTPAKRLSAAVAVARRARALDADVLVGLGGGSSLDVATVAAVVLASDREPAGLARAVVETGRLPVPEGALPPLVTIPTTLAGAALSGAAGVTVDPDGGLASTAADGGVSDRRLTPIASVADPALVASTPPPVLRGSAPNGLDKAIESCYAATASPVTDATAQRALGLYRRGLPALGTDAGAGAAPLDADAVAPSVEATLLAEYGTARGEASTLSVLHAFGHALSRRYPLQQGVAHAVIAPHAIRALFDAVDARRATIAAGLGVPSGVPPGPGVVSAVEDLLGGLALPGRLRDVDGPEREALDAVARTTLDDPLMANAPSGYDPSPAELRSVLDAAW